MRRDILPVIIRVVDCNATFDNYSVSPRTATNINLSEEKKYILVHYQMAVKGHYYYYMAVYGLYN
jgi:hypothetical protein